MPVNSTGGRALSSPRQAKIAYDRLWSVGAAGEQLSIDRLLRAQHVHDFRRSFDSMNNAPNMRLGTLTTTLKDGTMGFYSRPDRPDDCFAAALATCLQVPIWEVPDPPAYRPAATERRGPGDDQSIGVGAAGPLANETRL